MRLIDADALENAMYYEAFETDSDMQKWDSGCWIRYKMFEKHLANAPTVDAVEVVRCKDCKHSHMTYDGSCKYCDMWDEDGEALYLEGDFFCAYGVRREDGEVR